MGQKFFIYMYDIYIKRVFQMLFLKMILRKLKKNIYVEHKNFTLTTLVAK
jgi:hypothetical protein